MDRARVASLFNRIGQDEVLDEQALESIPMRR
jgi:hypothetical protein